MSGQSNDDPGAQVNPGYAAAQLARALQTAREHKDEETRQRAAAKARSWIDALRGMVSGTVDVGSRKPIRDVPVWATPEVVHGGFATGRLRAAGPVTDEERTWAEQLGVEPSRDALNGAFLSEGGLGALFELLTSRKYELTVPEFGALMVVAYLARQGALDSAGAVLAEIQPWFEKLRFYPPKRDTAPIYDGTVTVASTADVVRQMRDEEPRATIAVEREAVEVWAPLYDALVELFLETVDGPEPYLEARHPDASGRWSVAGGWPCQVWPEGWSARCRETVTRYRDALAEHTHCGRARRKTDSMCRLFDLASACAEGTTLTGRDVGRIRLILARTLTVRGTGDARARHRAAQRATLAGPGHHRIAHALADRLDHGPYADGVRDQATVLEPVEIDGALHEVPEAMTKVVCRALRATPEELVRKRIITSGDALALVLPQITADIVSAHFDEPELRNLYAELYRAHRQRRSLLLLNLESQVRFEELPWVAPLHVEGPLTTKAVAEQSLIRVVALHFQSFPQAILPNKLMQEIRALAKEAGLELHLVDEIAADIFMRTFTAKYVRAAQVAADLLHDSLYARYYDIDYGAVAAISDIKPSRHGPSTSRRFDAMCAARAPVGGGGVSANGAIIEQQMILTTQNLAVLFSALDLNERMGEELRAMASRTFGWIVKRLRMKTDEFHARLIAIKNSAYAWRQMVFYLALCQETEQRAFLAEARTCLAEQDLDFQSRFLPALRGLEQAMDGEPPSGAGRCYLGWTVDRHWLM